LYTTFDDEPGENNVLHDTPKHEFGRRLMAELVALRTYAETLPSGRKETHAENVERVIAQHVKRFPRLERDIRRAFGPVLAKRAVPSMRTMQFAGRAIERSHARGYNCAYTAITSFADVADAFWLSMNGCGVGYSVQWRHVGQLPVIQPGDPDQSFVIPDDKEGWADSVKMLLANPKVRFDYSAIRAAGSPLSTGGTASGPKPLRDAHQAMRAILQGAVGRRLKPIEVHDIMCHQSDAVVVGGVRRAALICLFDADDQDMLACKNGDWWVQHGQRARANNSAVILRSDPEVVDKIRAVMAACYASQAGEPGLYLTNDLDVGTNPCGEISLQSQGLCNLSEVNVAACRDQDEFDEAVMSATAIGTLQAAYTDFHYLQAKWRKHAEAEALLGVSLTGQAERWDLIGQPDVLRRAGQLALDTNAGWAAMVGINQAARIGTTKPSGSTSTYLATTPGIHGDYGAFYLRRMQIDRDSPLASYLVDRLGCWPACSGNIVEDHFSKAGLIVVTAPHAARPGSIRSSDEPAIQLLERALHIKQNWIKPTHRSGPNTHNVSLTCYYRDHERDAIVDWLVQHRTTVNGIAFLPHDGGTYRQAPYEQVSEIDFHRWSNRFQGVELDFQAIDFLGHQDARIGELACQGGICGI
jgi:ribonucleoside-diphosphate reductase alpha chain